MAVLILTFNITNALSAGDNAKLTNPFLWTSFVNCILGPTGVLLFAGRSALLGSIVAIIGCVLDFANYLNFGIMGNMLFAIYCFIFYVITPIIHGKTIKVSKTNRANLYISIGLGLACMPILFIFGTKMLEHAGVPAWTFPLTCCCFTLQTIAMYLMIVGKRLNWYFWLIINGLNIVVQSAVVLSGNANAVFYIVITLFYTLGCLKGLQEWKE